jgi:RAC serine/threonine-protein kinase/serum/glucocorticoid-regulated kinase 2
MERNPDFVGFLKKKGFYNKSLKKRWFEIIKDRLYYYKNEKQLVATGMIMLQGCQAEQDPNKKMCLFLKGGKLKRKYELHAESQEECETWIKELRKAIEGKPTDLGKVDVEEMKKEEQKEVSVIVNTGKDPKAKISLEDFELLCVVGKGSFGKVMKCRKTDTGEILAMKVLEKQMLEKQNMIDYTKSEKNILQQIDHPYIVKLKYAFQTDTKLYLVLDFLSGGELFFHLSKEFKFDNSRARFYVAELALAIGYLHSKDIIYRDLKPENVVLDGEGHVQLTDFGLAKKNITINSPTKTFCGTPEYLAPEILRGKGYSKPVDWWSLGILFYEMLVGIPPFYAENMNEMYDLILKAPLKFPSFVATEAQDLLKGLLEKDETKRLGSGPSDIQEIKDHPYFQPINWDALYKRQIEPPFIPEKSENLSEAPNFDEEFTKEGIKESDTLDSSKGDASKTWDDFDTFDHQGELE